MNIPDYKARLIIEYLELNDRYEKLDAMLARYDCGELTTFDFYCPVYLLKHQLDVMREYRAVLHERIELEIPDFHNWDWSCNGIL